MTARLDASDVIRLESRLRDAAREIDVRSADWEDKWGEAWADGMRAEIAVETGRTRAAIVADGGEITFGDRADIVNFLEHGTVHMAPRPFIRPALRRIQAAAMRDAGDQAIRPLTRG